MRAGGQSGLTLVEILVVLAIIAVMSSVVVLGLGGAGQAQSAQAEARRLAASIQLASDEALVADRALALSWDAEGYSFVEWSGGGWQPHRSAGLGERHSFSEEISLSADSETAPLPIGENAPLNLTLKAGGQSWSVRFDGINANAAPVVGG